MTQVHKGTEAQMEKRPQKSTWAAGPKDFRTREDIEEDFWPLGDRDKDIWPYIDLDSRDIPRDPQTTPKVFQVTDQLSQNPQYTSKG